MLFAKNVQRYCFFLIQPSFLAKKVPKSLNFHHFGADFSKFCIFLCKSSSSKVYD